MPMPPKSPNSLVWFVLTTVVGISLALAGSWGKGVDASLARHDVAIVATATAEARREQQLEDIKEQLVDMNKKIDRLNDVLLKRR